MTNPNLTKFKLAKIIKEATLKAFPKTAAEIQVEYPKEASNSDYACNIAMKLASKIKQNPREIAEKIIKNLEKADFIEKTEIAGPGFINFWLSRDYLSKNLITILQQKEKYGSSKIGKNKKIMVEYSSPNTNKPLHLGHIRNNCIGMALGNILKFLGYEVILTSIINDRGIHICKSMLAYKLFGKNKTPQSTGKKPDHFVGDYYVLYNKKLKEDPSLEEKAREMLKKWEEDDKETLTLWKKMNNWVYEGFDETYKKIGSTFDVEYFESEVYKKGREIILKALDKGACEKNEGGVITIDLSKYGLGDKEEGKKVLIRSDGTSMYITMDIHLAVKRFHDYRLDNLIYVVGDEQIYHFKVLFKILELFGYKWVNKLHHLHYGMINLPEGKMKSREGKTVDSDDLIKELENMAEEEIKKRHEDIKGQKSKELAARIALAAIKYYILKVNHESTMVYDPKKSLDFEGNTGPYLQYAHARICSILAKASPAKEFDRSLLKEKEEIDLMRKLILFPEIIFDAGNYYRPHEIALYLYELAQKFNSFYTKIPVLKTKEGTRNARLNLIQAIAQVIKNGLELLGIEAVEKM